MTHLATRGVAMAVAMSIASALALAMKPSERIADRTPKIDLEAMLPREFGGWTVDSTLAPLSLSPEVRATLDKLYSQTLSRTYADARGSKVMLSIAYGGDQSDAMQVHKPEVCYPAQGFVVSDVIGARVHTEFGDLPVSRLVAQQRGRIEPITYWVTVGDRATNSGFARKLVQLRYGLTGKIPDGLLFRVSSIDRSEKHAYDLQEEFVRALLSAVSAEARLRLMGRLE